MRAAQAEASRVPLADGTLAKHAAVRPDSELMPSLLALSDVFGTGYHAAFAAGVSARTAMIIIGDGAVGLLAGNGGSRRSTSSPARGTHVVIAVVGTPAVYEGSSKLGGVVRPGESESC
jgi:hypothetical protein